MASAVGMIAGDDIAFASEHECGAVVPNIHRLGSRRSRSRLGLSIVPIVSYYGVVYPLVSANRSSHGPALAILGREGNAAREIFIGKDGRETKSFIAKAGTNSMNDEEARWLWKCILGREPESAEALQHFKMDGRTFAEARRLLLQSEEFAIANPRPPITYFIPERYPKPFVKSPRSLCLASIVKDEETNISNLILSCSPLLSFVVIVDTGSSDNTVTVAERILHDIRIPHLIAHVPFENFAQARNAALERVPRDMNWVLMLDADEEIVSADYWRFAPLLENDDVDAWHLPRFNFVDASKRMPVEHYPDYQLRLLRNRVEQPIRFVNKVHERPNLNIWTDAPIADCEKGDVGGPHIHHLGAINLTRERWQKKHDFYMRLMQLP